MQEGRLEHGRRPGGQGLPRFSQGPLELVRSGLHRHPAGETGPGQLADLGALIQEALLGGGARAGPFGVMLLQPQRPGAEQALDVAGLGQPIGPGRSGLARWPRGSHEPSVIEKRQANHRFLDSRLQPLGSIALRGEFSVAGIANGTKVEVKGTYSSGTFLVSSIEVK